MAQILRKLAGKGKCRRKSFDTGRVVARRSEAQSGAVAPREKSLLPRRTKSITRSELFNVPVEATSHRIQLSRIALRSSRATLAEIARYRSYRGQWKIDVNVSIADISHCRQNSLLMKPKNGKAQ
jgi:hypothetical protein